MREEQQIPSTAEEFRAKYEQRRNTEAALIALPSGLKVQARRPDPEWWLRHLGFLPASLAGKIIGAEAEISQDDRIAELLKYADWMLKLIGEIIVSPAIRLNPGPGEIDPHWISEQDINYLIKYGRGEVSADGRDFSMFPGKRGSGDRTGEAGESVELSPQ